MGFVSVNWSFMEAGHGKGAPDGVGAVIKRCADKSVLFGHDITDAKTMMDALNHANIAPELYLVEEGSFLECEQKISAGMRPVPGTMKIHQVSD